MILERVLIIGAGGQGLATSDILHYSSKYEVIGYVDKNESLHGEFVGEYKVLGDISIIFNNRDLFDAAIVAIGDNYQRRLYYDLLLKLNIPLINAIHDNTTISSMASIGKGVYIGAGAVIGANVSIGHNTIINCNTTLPHNNMIESHVNISPGVHLGGGTVIGEHTFIGIGSSVIQYLKIGKDSIIGAGSTVIKDLSDGVVAVGIPARVIKVNCKK